MQPIDSNISNKEIIAKQQINLFAGISHCVSRKETITCAAIQSHTHTHKLLSQRSRNYNLKKTERIKIIC